MNLQCGGRSQNAIRRLPCRLSLTGTPLPGHFDTQIDEAHSHPETDRKTGVHCARCRLPPRWCVCAGSRTVSCPLQVDVLVHHREAGRPSSTGGVIHRTLAGSRRHLWQSERQIDASAIIVPGRELWILHPAGLPMPVGIGPESVQVLLLDGSWRESTTMARKIGSWGRRVALPMSGKSRFLLRAQHSDGRFSTVEALLFLLKSFELTEAHAELQVQFELHVYAGLRARGRKVDAKEFLKESPLEAALSDLLAQLNLRRPSLSSRKEHSTSCDASNLGIASPQNS